MPEKGRRESGGREDREILLETSSAEVGNQRNTRYPREGQIITKNYLIFVYFASQYRLQRNDTYKSKVSCILHLVL